MSRCRNDYQRREGNREQSKLQSQENLLKGDLRNEAGRKLISRRRTGVVRE